MKIRYILLFLCAAAFFMAVSWIDLALRGRSAFLKAESYMATASSTQEPASGAAAAHAEAPEDAAKYAYIWYRTAAEDFSPPETRWTRQARLKAPEALALWRSYSAERRR